MKISRKLMLWLICLVAIFTLCGAVVSAEEEPDVLCYNYGCDGVKCVWVEKDRVICDVTYELICPNCESWHGSKEVVEHDFQEYSRIDATCKSSGKVFYSCITEGCLETRSEVLPLDPAAHTYCNWIVEKVPTCIVEGSHYKVCTNYSVNDDGTKTYCDNKVTEAIPTDDNAHVYDGEWIKTVSPTCEAEGEEYTVCTVCNSSETTRAIAKHTETLSEDVYEILSEPSCIKEGSMKGVCTKCNANVVVTLPKTQEHSWVLSEKVEAECEKEGSITSVCQWHKDIEKTETISATGHSFTAYVSNGDATCKKDGTKTAKCDKCDSTDTVADEGSITAHTASKWIITSGSCEKGGTAYKNCVYCKDVMVESRTFAAGVHLNRSTVTVPASCVADGYKSDMCTDCGTVWTQETVKAGHTYPDAWTVEKEATCADEGLRTKTCAKCSQVKEEVIEKTPHAYMIQKEGLEATCLEDGYTAERFCMRCFYTEHSVVLPALGHIDTDNNGNCNRCYVYFVQTDNGVVDCSCICHNEDGLAKFVFKIMTFFYKLFRTNQVCECGKLHY